jgi:wobble nucleotide-excising tRNase
MITKISLKKVASYGDNPAVLETDKKINLIYGLNGTGKTTLSNFLQNTNATCFSDCSIEGLNTEKILVYNQKFIGDNFYEDTQKGIFSLKSENKEAKEKIDTAFEEIKKISAQVEDSGSKTGLKFDLEKKRKDIEALQNTTEEKTWEIKSKYSGGDRILEFCLDGKMGSKTVLFDYISRLPKSSSQPSKIVEDLKKEAEATQGTNAVTYNEGLINKINYDFWKIEEKEIYKEVIIGNDTSQVANLISKLSNSDWVKKGKEYIKEPQKENELCPFCQQKTISQPLYQEIQSYFDETYQNKITELDKLEKEYFREYQNAKSIEEEIFQIDFIKDKEIELRLLFNNLIDSVRNNWSNISNKIKSPNVVVDLKSTILVQKELNDFLETIVEDIRVHNDKVINKSKTKNQIIKDFWEIMRWNYDQTIVSHKTQEEKLLNEKLDIESKISDFNSAIQEQQNVIKEAQKEIVNIQDAVNNINDELIFFGLDGFSIVPTGEESYKMQRPNEDITKFETLSEGEKTVISFLYFLELCKGKSKVDEVVTEKIVVIDDPISSLSHMYVFNVSQLIKNNFFNDEYKQVFVLTHNLYLFHELIMYTKNNKAPEREKLFRITKNQNKESHIYEMNSGEIMNDYQSYWKVLKDHNENMASDCLLANSMRNILEYFFGFIDNEKYDKAIEKLTESKYTYFLRYINRESHFDRINVSDTKEIDPEIFKEAFKRIFEDTGYGNHYKKMIDD